MRKKAKAGDFSVHAIAGTYVVLLGMNIKEGSPLRKGLLGFAIFRRNEKTGKEGWIPGYKIFEPKEGEPEPEKGKLVSSEDFPIQGFLWGDYMAERSTLYTYKVVPMYGSPGALKPGKSVKLSITTEDPAAATHGIFFNRGAAASQAYARKFGTKTPDQVGTAAFKWLSRGLEEAMLEFIAQAKDKSFAIRGAVYEFSYAPVLKALKAAADRKADVSIIYDFKAGDKKPGKRNEIAVKKAKLKSCCIQRTSNNSYIAHNKFMVLLKNGKPREVWTGSTNITEGGIFGHSNVGHIIRDPKVAAAYLAYWTELAEDPTAKDLSKWADQHSPLPVNFSKPGITPVFSPRGSETALEVYSAAMDEAKEGVFLTAAFGINPLFQAVLAEDKPYLRYLLLEREDKRDPAKPNVALYQRDRENMVAVGAYLDDTVLEKWIRQKFNEEELTGLNTHVRYIHTKYMLLDPLSKMPIVITGSANFSKASTRNNDENMVIIRGDKRVADIYLGEFMRLFSHYRFRWFAQRAATTAAVPQRLYLRDDNSWTKSYYRKGSSKMLERRMFA